MALALSLPQAPKFCFSCFVLRFILKKFQKEGKRQRSLRTPIPESSSCCYVAVPTTSQISYLALHRQDSLTPPTSPGNSTLSSAGVKFDHHQSYRD